MKMLPPNIDDFYFVNPYKVESYLENHGWQEVTKLGDLASVWRTSEEGKVFELLLPLDKSVPDFPDRMYEAVRTISKVEERPENEIYEGLKDVNQVAIEKGGREVINLALLLPSYYGIEAPIAKLGTVLCTLQDVINGIGQTLAIIDGQEVSGENQQISEELISKRISSEIAEEMQLSAFGSFKSSFGIKLVSSPTNLLNSHLITDAIKEFVGLIRVGSNADGLKERLLKLRSSSARRYIEFLRSLISARAGVQIDWGSTKPNCGGSAKLPLEGVEATLKSIEELKTETTEFVELEGKLIEANVKTKHFIFIDVRGVEYKGYISKEAMPISRVIPLNQHCNVVIEEVTTDFFVTSKISKTYKIVRLDFPGQEGPTQQFSLF